MIKANVLRFVRIDMVAYATMLPSADYASGIRPGRVYLPEALIHVLSTSVKVFA